VTVFSFHCLSSLINRLRLFSLHGYLTGHFLPYFTVIVAVPFFFAVTTPLELTIATFLLEERHVIFSCDVIGVIIGFNVIFFPFFIVIFFKTPEILVVLTVRFCTFTIII